MNIRINVLLVLLFVILLTGCSNPDGVLTYSDNYEKIREVAWIFLKEKNWDDRVKEDWRNAKVGKITIDKSYELFDDSYIGTEVFYVSFEDKKELPAATPFILVDQEHSKVIGYIPSE